MVVFKLKRNQFFMHRTRKVENHSTTHTHQMPRRKFKILELGFYFEQFRWNIHSNILALPWIAPCVCVCVVKFVTFWNSSNFRLSFKIVSLAPYKKNHLIKSRNNFWPAQTLTFGSVTFYSVAIFLPNMDRNKCCDGKRATSEKLKNFTKFIWAHVIL